jgi:hypothetical protein
MSSGSVQFDTSFDIKIKKSLLKTHSLQKLFPDLNWNEEKKSLETAHFVIGNSFNQLKGYKEQKFFETCGHESYCKKEPTEWSKTVEAFLARISHKESLRNAGQHCSIP